MEKETTIIDVGGIKMEIDLRQAKVIDQYKVGDNIKVLVKEYGEKFKSFIGTIIGFDNFKTNPTIVIAYLQTEYGSATIKYLYYNSLTKEAEICPLNDWDLPVTKQQVLDRFQSEIEKAKRKIAETEQKQRLFEQLFGKYFEKVELDLPGSEDLPFS